MFPLGCLPLWGREGVTLTTGGNLGELPERMAHLQNQKSIILK
jgi:hypothetical protein